MSISKLVVAICFNDFQKSQELVESLTTFGLNCSFILCSSFDQFLKDFMSSPKIDCCIIEENYTGCSSVEFIQKIKQSQKYKKTATIVTLDDLAIVRDEISAINADLLISNSMNPASIVEGIVDIVEKKNQPIIPENYNVLVLDNNEDILEVITCFLDKMEHKTFELCTSVAAAKDKLSENHYDLLLLDWNLDDGTCLDVMEFIKYDVRPKKLKNDLALPIVITGRDDVDDIMTLLSHGVKDHIIKPFDFCEFEDKVEYAIKKHRSTVSTR